MQEEIDAHGQWQPQNNYVSKQVTIQDAKVASKLCMGGPHEVHIDW